MYKICVYIPETHLEIVKGALFQAGAGHQGEYAECCWQTKGVGQFRPMKGGNPFIGSEGGLEHVSEYRVEMLCEHNLLRKVIEALKRAHPYEEPAFDIIKLIDVDMLNAD